MDFRGEIGKTVEESTPWWPEPKKPSDNAPNVVIIMLDDLGFAQLGCYGSTISTPNIDRLAENGLRYNNFHTPAMCSPARASLLTGRNPHATGVSFVSEFDLGFPNARGKVRKDTMMLSEMLVEEGYNTFALGKWHLAPGNEQTNTGPFDGWPLARGFEKYYGYLQGATNQFYPDLVEGNERVNQPKKPEEGYHLTEDLTNRAIKYVRAQKSEAPEKPFFCYLAFAAPHSPHQAPREFIDKYKGKFDHGWDKVREEWFERQKEIGIIPKDAELPPRNPDVRPWDSLTEDEQRLFARMQEAFAGFLEHTDYHIGRFIDELDRIGELDNTLIVFLSDNGACGNGGKEGTVNAWNPKFTAKKESLEEKVRRIDEIGGKNANNHYPSGWAMAGNTPFKFYKTFTHEGGVRCPLIIHYPEKIKDKGGIRTQYHYITDITPTILELTNVEMPEVYKGIKQQPIHGVSMRYTFDDQYAPTKKDVQYYEIAGNRGIWKDGWKCVNRHEPNTPFTDDNWELYDTTNDFTEVHNLAEEKPDVLEELVALWWKEAEKYHVLPLDGRTLREKIRFTNKHRQTNSERTERTFYGSPALYHQSVVPILQDKSFRIEMEIERIFPNEDGFILAHGDNTSGYAIYIKDNRLHVYYNNSNRSETTIVSSSEVPMGEVLLRFDLMKTNTEKALGMIFIQNEKVAETEIDDISGFHSPQGFLSIGRASRAPVTAKAIQPFAFCGEIFKVTYMVDVRAQDFEEYVYSQVLRE